MSAALDAAWAAGIGLLAVGLIFTPLERAYMARVQPVFRPRWTLDLAFFLGQYLVFNTAIVWALEACVAGWAQVAPQGIRVAALWPWWAQVVLVVLLGDLCIYWVHRVQHRVEWLWRFHGVHHTTEHLDWMAAHREHPVDGLITRFAINLPAIMLGVSLAPVAGFIVFRGLWAIFIHSNTRLSPGPLKYLLGSPHLHQWHHAKGRFAGNYGNLNPLMDVIFGTHYDPPELPEELGTEEVWPTGYWGLLSHPFRRRDKAAVVNAAAGGAVSGSRPALRGDPDHAPASTARDQS